MLLSILRCHLGNYRCSVYIYLCIIHEIYNETVLTFVWYFIKLTCPLNSKVYASVKPNVNDEIYTCCVYIGLLRDIYWYHFVGHSVLMIKESVQVKSKKSPQHIDSYCENDDFRSFIMFKESASIFYVLFFVLN